MKQQLTNIASIIDSAAKNVNAITQLSSGFRFDLKDAYIIQKLSIDRRLERGEKLTGYKLGFTSKAKMEQMGVHEVIFGSLTDGMFLQNKGELNFNQFIHPRAEPEIAFRVSKKIDKILSLENALEYIDGVAGAIEVIDSRYKKFQFSLEDVVADNCSSAAYVIGEWQETETSIQDLQIELIINGITCQSGNSNAILGNPLESIVEISKMSLKYGQPLEAGQIILAGAATSAEYLKKGDEIQAVFQNLGTVSFKS